MNHTTGTGFVCCGALRCCLAAKFDSCNSLLSSIHTLLVNILRCVRLYVKRKFIILYSLQIGYELKIKPEDATFTKAMGSSCVFTCEISGAEKEGNYDLKWFHNNTEITDKTTRSVPC